MHPLCRPDCPGLCPGCGRHLDVGSCDCAEWLCRTSSFSARPGRGDSRASRRPVPRRARRVLREALEALHQLEEGRVAITRARGAVEPLHAASCWSPLRTHPRAGGVRKIQNAGPTPASGSTTSGADDTLQATRPLSSNQATTTGHVRLPSSVRSFSVGSSRPTDMHPHNASQNNNLLSQQDQPVTTLHNNNEVQHIQRKMKTKKDRGHAQR